MSALDIACASLTSGMRAAEAAIKSYAAELEILNLRLPTYPENDRCEFCGRNPWTKLAKQKDGTYHLCGVCNATCQECAEVGGHLTSCSEFQREPEAADRPLRDWDREAEDARL